MEAITGSPRFDVGVRIVPHLFDLTTALGRPMTRGAA